MMEFPPLEEMLALRVRVEVETEVGAPVAIEGVPMAFVVNV